MIPEKLRELHEKKVTAIRRAKEDLLSKDGEEVMNTLTTGLRDYEEVVMAQALPDRDLQIAAMSYFLKGFGCTQINMGYETYWCGTNVNPMTDEPWEAGELQYVFEHYPESKEYIQDSLSITTIDEEGHVLSSSYAFVHEGNTVVWTGNDQYWDSEMSEEEVAHVRTAAALRDTLRELAGETDMRKKLLGVMGTLDPERTARMVDKLDCALVVQANRKFKDQIQIGLLAEPDSEREKLIKSSFDANKMTVITLDPKGDIEVRDGADVPQ